MNKHPFDKILSYAQKNDPQGIHDMINNGTPATHSNRVGQSSLHIAALWGNDLALKALLSHIPKGSMDLNIKNKIGGSTPLHSAANSNKKLKGRMECVRLLLAHGADPTITDAYDSPPSAYASDPEMRIMLGGSQLQFHRLFQDLYTKDTHKDDTKDTKVVPKLDFGGGILNPVKGLFNPSSTTSDSNMDAVDSDTTTNNPDDVVLQELQNLISTMSPSKALESIQSADSEGRTALHVAVTYVLNECTLELVLSAFNDIEGMVETKVGGMTDNEGRSIGHVYVSRFGKSRQQGESWGAGIIKIMKELGMQVGTREYGEGDGMGGPPKENETIVVKAIRKGDWGICNSIMSTYADEGYQDGWREKTEDGETPWQVALTEIGRVELARLVREGEDVNEAPKTWAGNTVLHDACKRGRVEVVRYVVGEGGDVNGKGRQGFTPTVLACRGGMVEVVRLCLEGGGDWKVVVAGKNGREWAEGQGKRGEGVVELIDGWEE